MTATPRAAPSRAAPISARRTTACATAPARAILCAGAGHFASAHVTLTDGLFVGRGEDAAARVVSEWDRITDRRGEVVPAYGFTQAERELANAGFTAPTMAVQR